MSTFHGNSSVCHAVNACLSMPCVRKRCAVSRGTAKNARCHTRDVLQKSLRMPEQCKPCEPCKRSALNNNYVGRLPCSVRLELCNQCRRRKCLGSCHWPLIVASTDIALHVIGFSQRFLQTREQLRDRWPAEGAGAGAGAVHAMGLDGAYPGVFCHVMIKKAMHLASDLQRCFAVFRCGGCSLSGMSIRWVWR